MAKKILFITLSNIGDVILTLPALDALRESFPESKITVMAGPRPGEIFQGNPFIDRLIIYHKHAPLSQKLKLYRQLRKEKFDLVVDLRNSLWGLLIPARLKPGLFLRMPAGIRHMKERHLHKALAAVGAGGEFSGISRIKSLHISPADERYVAELLKQQGIKNEDEVIIVSPGARSHTKRWPQDRFAGLIEVLGEEFKARIILVGDKEDAPIAGYIAEHSGSLAINLAAKTTIPQLALLLKRARCVITNDSAVLHLAGYADTPTVAIFGLTDEARYGPWSAVRAVVKKEIFCRPCKKAQCKFGTLECIQAIKAQDVLRQARKILGAGCQLPDAAGEEGFKRILIVRTDRIGDVLLSTPVISALRSRYPYAYIAMLVSAYAKDIVDGNPHLDKVIIYDKDGKHKSWRRSIEFALNLKKKKFDLAIVFHPTNRMHLVTFFAAIPKRIGYDRKLGFLLTDRIRHDKQSGEKHELEYALDLVRYLGIEAKETNLCMPLKPESEKWAEALLRQEGVGPADKLLAIHPGASCPSKIWPKERFAQVSDKLAEKYGLRVVIVAGPKDITLAQNVIKHLRHPAIDLAGKISVSQLASLLKRCRLFISNDSGPVHIASAVGVPVISIFGRAQKGLSPKRWGPWGGKGLILHKDVGCLSCLAHNCLKGFLCLKAITVDDVLNVAEEVLRS